MSWSPALAFAYRLLGSYIQHVCGLMHPTPLSLGRVIDLRQGLPEAQGAVARRQIWPHRQAAVLEIEEEGLPGLLTLPHPILHSDQLFVPVGGGPNHDQETARDLHSYIHVQTIHPEVDISLPRQIPLLPRLPFLLPGRPSTDTPWPGRAQQDCPRGLVRLRRNLRSTPLSNRATESTPPGSCSAEESEAGSES
jgi:hypothetical protein